MTGETPSVESATKTEDVSSDDRLHKDWSLLVDESDMLDTWRAFVGMRLSGEAHGFDVGPFVQTRERRRVVGDRRQAQHRLGSHVLDQRRA